MPLAYCTSVLRAEPWSLLTQVYHESASPVEDFFREQGVLLDFDINGGIPETVPRLMRELEPFRRHMEEYQSTQPEEKRMVA